MMRRPVHPLTCALAIGLLLGGCATTQTKRNLYDDLGAMAGINATTDLLLGRFAADPRIRPAFAHADMLRFKKQFSLQICEVAGGPCKYQGDAMAEVHHGMAIDEGQFNAVVEAYIGALTDRGISVPVQNRLLARLARMRGGHHSQVDLPVRGNRQSPRDTAA